MFECIGPCKRIQSGEPLIFDNTFSPTKEKRRESNRLCLQSRAAGWSKKNNEIRISFAALPYAAPLSQVQQNEVIITGSSTMMMKDNYGIDNRKCEEQERKAGT